MFGEHELFIALEIGRCKELSLASFRVLNLVDTSIRCVSAGGRSLWDSSSEMGHGTRGTEVERAAGTLVGVKNGSVDTE